MAGEFDCYCVRVGRIGAASDWPAANFIPISVNDPHVHYLRPLSGEVTTLSLYGKVIVPSSPR